MSSESCIYTCSIAVIYSLKKKIKLYEKKSYVCKLCANHPEIK